MKLCFPKAIKRIVFMLGTLIFALMVCTNRAYASDSSKQGDVEIYHNEEELDEDTGEVKKEKQEGEEGYKVSVPMGDSASYDAVRELFKYSFGTESTDTVTSNVANGMFTNSSVKLQVGSSLVATLYLNGNEAKNVDFENITTPGNYVLRISSKAGEDLGSFCFRITKLFTNTSRYKIPEGFSIVEAVCDGMAQYGSENTILMDEEGFYSITIVNDYTKIQYHYEAMVDHTPPSLKLEAVNEKLTAKSSIDISDVEEGASLLVYWNDQLIETPKVLTTPGRYQLVLTDEAGNISTYQFILYMYFTVTSTIIIALVGVIIVALVIYLLMNKKKQRVR